MDAKAHCRTDCDSEADVLYAISLQKTTRTSAELRVAVGPLVKYSEPRNETVSALEHETVQGYAE